MADTEKTRETTDTKASGTPGGDEIKNLKSEMSRKLSNLEENNKALMAKLESLVKPAPTQKTEKEPELDDLLYTNPKEYARLVKEEAKKAATTVLTEASTSQRKQADTVGKLVHQYPELQFSDQPLYQRAVEIYNSMDPDDKTHPIAYEAAVKEAASELGVKPRSKRSAEELESFSFGAGRGSSETRERKERTTVDPRTLLFAEAVGLNVKDTKVVERLKGKHGRKTYNNWE